MHLKFLLECLISDKDHCHWTTGVVERCAFMSLQTTDLWNLFSVLFSRRMVLWCHLVVPISLFLLETNLWVHLSRQPFANVLQFVAAARWAITKLNVNLLLLKKRGLIIMSFLYVSEAWSSCTCYCYWAWGLYYVCWI